MEEAKTCLKCPLISECKFRNKNHLKIASSMKQVKNNAKFSEEIHEFSGVGDATLRDVLVMLLGATNF